MEKTISGIMYQSFDEWLKQRNEEPLHDSNYNVFGWGGDKKPKKVFAATPQGFIAALLDKVGVDLDNNPFTNAIGLGAGRNTYYNKGGGRGEIRQGIIPKKIDERTTKQVTQDKYRRNAQLQHPIRGARERWRNSINNGSNPIQGLTDVVGPIVSAALMAESPAALGALYKTAKSAPLLTTAGLGLGTVATSVGNRIGAGIDSALGGGNTFETIGTSIGLPGYRPALDPASARRAIYRQYLPFSYRPNLRAGKEVIKEMMYPAQELKPTPVSETVEKVFPLLEGMTQVPWIRRNFKGIDTKKAHFFHNRNQAWAKAMRQPEDFKYPIYKEIGTNEAGNSIVEYNLPNLNLIHRFTPGAPPPSLGIRNSYMRKYDTIGGNHGNINANGKIDARTGDGLVEFWDVWDLNPLRSLTNRLGNRIPVLKKPLDAIGNYDWVKGVGGNPFEWRQTFNMPIFKDPWAEFDL